MNASGNNRNGLSASVRISVRREHKDRKILKSNETNDNSVLMTAKVMSKTGLILNVGNSVNNAKR